MYVGLSTKLGPNMWHLWEIENMTMPGLLLVFLFQKVQFKEPWSGYMFWREKEYLHRHVKNLSYVKVC